MKSKHDLSNLNYVLKHDFDKHPECACGCGEKVKFKKWKFDKYYQNHKNKVEVSVEVRKKISDSLLKVDNATFLGLDKYVLEESWELYKMPEYPSCEISKKYGVDYRVIKKYWLSFGIASLSEINRYAKLHKSTWSNKESKNGQYQNIEDDCLFDIYQLLSSKKHFYTLSFIKNHFGLKNSKFVIKKRLVEKYGKEEIDKVLKSGNSSKSEVDFGYVLKFYFGEKNVKSQFKINRKIYDFLLYDKLIVEYDGEYWHSNKKDRDLEKNKLAHSHGYALIRVSDKKDKDIGILNNIKDILIELGVTF